MIKFLSMAVMALFISNGFIGLANADHHNKGDKKAHCEKCDKKEKCDCKDDKCEKCHGGKCEGCSHDNKKGHSHGDGHAEDKHNHDVKKEEAKKH